MQLSLTDIEFYAYHGVMAEERAIGTWYAVSVFMDVEEKACLTDDLADTVDYALVYEQVKEEMAKPSNLIEHAACRIADRIKSGNPLVHGVRVRLTKKHPPIPGANINATVEICR